MLQRWLLGMVLVALVGVMAIGAWSFVWPSTANPAQYRLAPEASFEPGSVTSYVLSGGELEPLLQPQLYWSGVQRGEIVHVVRFPDGQFRVLAGVSSHRGQAVLWLRDRTAEVGNFRGLFDDNFTVWTIDGVQVLGPAPRDLARYRWELDEDGVLVIDLTGAEEQAWNPGNRTREFPPPYDVTAEGWATSGWPSR